MPAPPPPPVPPPLPLEPEDLADACFARMEAAADKKLRSDAEEGIPAPADSGAAASRTTGAPDPGDPGDPQPSRIRYDLGSQDGQAVPTVDSGHSVSFISVRRKHGKGKVSVETGRPVAEEGIPAPAPQRCFPWFKRKAQSDVVRTAKASKKEKEQAAVDAWKVRQERKEREAARRAQEEATRRAEEQEEAKRKAEQRKAEEFVADWGEEELEAARRAEEEEARRAEEEEEAQRKAEEEEEAQRKAEEKAQEEAASKAKEEAERKAALEAEAEATRKTAREAERKAQEEEAARKTKEEAERKAQQIGSSARGSASSAAPNRWGRKRKHLYLFCDYNGVLNQDDRNGVGWRGEDVFHTCHQLTLSGKLRDWWVLSAVGNEEKGTAGKALSRYTGQTVRQSIHPYESYLGRKVPSPGDCLRQFRDDYGCWITTLKTGSNNQAWGKFDTACWGLQKLGLHIQASQMLMIDDNENICEEWTRRGAHSILIKKWDRPAEKIRDFVTRYV